MCLWKCSGIWPQLFEIKNERCESSQTPSFARSGFPLLDRILADALAGLVLNILNEALPPPLKDYFTFQWILSPNCVFQKVAWNPSFVNFLTQLTCTHFGNSPASSLSLSLATKQVYLQMKDRLVFFFFFLLDRSACWGVLDTEDTVVVRAFFSVSSIITSLLSATAWTVPIHQACQETQSGDSVIHTTSLLAPISPWPRPHLDSEQIPLSPGVGAVSRR